MRKKGSLSIEQIIVIALAIFIVSAFAYLIINLVLGYTKDNVENLIPGFEDDLDPEVGDAIVRYHIVNDNVDFFDGTSWVSLKDKVIDRGDGIEVSDSEIIESFTSRYYHDRSDFIVDIGALQADIKLFSRTGEDVELATGSGGFKTLRLAGQIYFEVVNPGNENEQYVMNHDNDVYQRRLNTGNRKIYDDVGGTYLPVRRWRDAPLETPIEIKGKTYCVDPFYEEAGSYYVIRLDKEDQTGTCEI